VQFDWTLAADPECLLIRLGSAAELDACEQAS